ncbi:MAG TPA: 1-deoxy-D-xylulose-5-phosphate reductoisomerase [Firmicutes bacterium]|nr:1-deoxy-D-xylulose-5-phosphate reductoisomerase [Bacillota bacterium]
MNTLGILGSTGSIGCQALQVVEALPEEIKVTALAAGRNVELLAAQALKFRPEVVAIADEERYTELKQALSATSIKVLTGEEGVNYVAAGPESQTVLAAIVGIAGLKPTLAAVQKGKRVALANKETLVTAGSIVQQERKKSGSEILPVDSEHSAIWQSLRSGRKEEVQSIILTASGGPFRTWSKKDLAQVTIKEALRHPNWDMGAKITVDSATLMNKGLEVLEAQWLFELPLEQIKVLVHPESIVHSLVEFVDGAVIGQLGLPDMRLPIQLALTYPRRLKAPWPRLGLTGKTLTFEEPDTERFPSLRLARQAGEVGGTAPTVLNAANEVAVAEFLSGRLAFSKIPLVVEQVLSLHQSQANPTLETIFAVDTWARDQVMQVMSKE